MSDNRGLRQFLQSLKSAGISHLPYVVLPKAVPKPHRLARSAATQAKVTAPVSPIAPPKTLPGQIKTPQTLRETLTILDQPLESLADKQNALQQLSEIVAKCNRCQELADGRRQTVFGVGNANAKVMFIGEAPDADEDRVGEPFVGAAGQLLDKIIAAAELKREELYICNILRCRPPGNRNPQAQEAANCREFLDGQIKIVAPEYIVCWGTVAAQNLLETTDPVGKLRGRFRTHGKAKVLCTYHPSYLLRNPDAKKLVWEDMKLLMAELEIQP